MWNASKVALNFRDPPKARKGTSSVRLKAEAKTIKKNAACALASWGVWEFYL